MWEKLEWCDYPMVKKVRGLFRGFKIIQACDRQTDWRLSLHYAQHRAVKMLSNPWQPGLRPAPPAGATYDACRCQPHIKGSREDKNVLYYYTQKTDQTDNHMLDILLTVISNYTTGIFATILLFVILQGSMLSYVRWGGQFWHHVVKHSLLHPLTKLLCK